MASLVENVIGAGLKGFGVMGAVGAIGCVVSAFVKEKQRTGRRNAAKDNIQSELLQYDAVGDHFITLHEIQGGDTHMLKKAQNRCLAIINLYTRIQAADPSTVSLGLISDANTIYQSFLRYLREFYSNSRVTCSRVGDRTMPMKKELAEAHTALLQVMDIYKHNITLLVSDKVREAVTNRV
jgi:hypothetical protein